MKTTPMPHQSTGLNLLAANREFYLLGCEQGTGKTWMLMADAEQRFSDGDIDGLLVVAPKGVHTNWIRREIPAHMSVAQRSGYYLSGAGKRKTAELEKLFRPSDERVLTILAINIDAVNHKEGFLLAKRFLQHYKCMMVVDESSRIKNPSAERTKRVIVLGKFAAVRRAASGTPITNSPIDIFSQMEFLSPGTGVLGTTSYRAFVAEYSVLLPADHHLMRSVASRSKFSPQIVARDKNGLPLWRNLDRLKQKLAPFMFRVLKSECLSLPEKIYQTLFFELAPKQRGIYDVMSEEMRLNCPDGEIAIFNSLTKLTKLRQITSGFVLLYGDAVLIDPEDNPRMSALKEAIEDLDGQFIVWASFREELAQITVMLRKVGIECVQYHGGVSTTDREIAVDEFQSGKARAFVGQPHSGGIGLTLTNAETVIYYSSDYNLEDRLQSEDRAHRIGTTKHVVYVDLAATGTIDERIALSLQTKEAVAERILSK